MNHLIVGMANIEKRTSQDGQTTYRVKIRLKGFPVKNSTFERLSDARKWAQQTEAAIREGRHFKTTAAKRHTLNEAIDRYVKNILPTKPKSEYTQERQLGWWKQVFGSYSLADVTPALLAQHRDKLAQEKVKHGKFRTPATVNRYLAALSHVFTVAMKEWMWLEENPLRKLTKMKEPQGRVRFLSDDELTCPGIFRPT